MHWISLDTEIFAYGLPVETANQLVRGAAIVEDSSFTLRLQSFQSNCARSLLIRLYRRG